MRYYKIFKLFCLVIIIFEIVLLIYFKSSSNFPNLIFFINKQSKKLPINAEYLSDFENSSLLPENSLEDDRIVKQLNFVPRNYEQVKMSGILKKIYSPFSDTIPGSRQRFFLDLKCPVDTCEFVSQYNKDVDLYIYKEDSKKIFFGNNKKAFYMLYTIESPKYFQEIPDIFNWIATYRSFSDIVAPYGKWLYYDENVKQLNQSVNYAEKKTKNVAWFVSNCDANNNRYIYAMELKKYIDVDIFGSCGSKKCPKSQNCFDMLKNDYKFYLAFENINCREYITEKFYINAMENDILPIVMGARPEDYEKLAPHKSYIHVDSFQTPKDLANYLHALSKDDELYNSYFKWKGTGELINTKFFCRVCALLHNENALGNRKFYKNVKKRLEIEDNGETSCQNF